MNNVEDIPDFVFQRALVSASGVNILNLCSFLILNNFICFNKMVLRLGVGGRKQDKAFNMPFVSFNMLSTKNFGSVDLINKEFIISHSKKSKYKTVPGLIDLAAHWHHKDSGSFPFFVQLSSAESLQPQANGNQFLGAMFLSQWPDIDWKLFLHFINVFNFSQKHSRRFPLISLARIVSDPLPTAITSKRKEATVIALD